MTDTEPTTRTQSFPHPDVADIQVHLSTGEVLVELVDTDTITVAVSPASIEPRESLGARLGLVRRPGRDAVADAVRQTTTHFTRGRLVVQAPNRRLAPVPVRVVVRAKPGSKVRVTGGAAHFTVTGEVRTLVATWDTGDLTVENVYGRCKVRGGSGRIHVGASRGELDVRLGTADVDVLRISGTAHLTTGNGNVAIGTVEADLSVTTGARSVVIADAAAGHIRVKTGPGSVKVGVRPGIPASVDVSSLAGSARNDLAGARSSAPPSDGRAVPDLPLRITAASTSGDIVVASAA